MFFETLTTEKSATGHHLLEEDLPDPAHGLDEDDSVGAAPRGEEGDDGREADVHHEGGLPLQLELDVVREHPLLLVHPLHPQQDVGQQLKLKSS